MDENKKEPHSQVYKLIKEVLKHMSLVAEGEQHGRILLAGDPGIGKTTFVQIMAEVFGMKLITIEIPHITEEHLINIPFITYEPDSKKQAHGKLQMEPSDESDEDDADDGEYKLVLAHSNLFTMLKSARPQADAAYLKHMNTTAKPHIKEIFVALGGSEDTIPEQIAEVRANHNSILFLDEYWRQTSIRIRNILREILNNNIGMHKIPNSTYIVYASNMRDVGGLEDQPPNAQFKTIEFKAPTKKDWFKWLESEYHDPTHPHVHLKPEVRKAFEAGMTDEDISVNHAESDVRTSPRRWAQLILYVNTSLPVENQDDAKSLLHNVGNYFINYDTEEHNEELRDRIKKIVAKLIKDTSKITISHTSKNEDDEWRKSFEHYIKQYMRASGKRKHVPIISGPPGIGKTMFSHQAAAAHNLVLVEIPSSGLSAEDVIGMPLPGDKSKDGKEITVKFSIPKLYRQVKSKIKEEESKFFAQLKEKYGKDGEAKIKEFKEQEWKYLIFFDEINTVGDEKTFNALRRVLLEKNFGPGNKKDADGNHTNLELPKDAIIFAAINPQGSHTQPMTGHFKDVVDIIPSKANWNHTKDWLLQKKLKNVDPAVYPVTMNIIEELIDRFETKDGNIPKERRPFQFDVESASFGISPREYADMFTSLAKDIDVEIKELRRNDDSEMTADKIRAAVDGAISKSLEQSVNNSFYREQHILERDEFAQRLEPWVSSLHNGIFNGLLNIKIETSKSFSNFLDGYLTGGKSLLKLPADPHLTNISTSISDSDIIDDVASAFADTLKTKEDLTKFILNETEKKIEIGKDGESIVHGSEKVPPFANFTLAFIFSLFINGFDYKNLGTMSKAVNKALGGVLTKLEGDSIIDDDEKTDFLHASVSFRIEVLDLIDQLKDNANAKEAK